MKNMIEELTDFDTKIQTNPLETSSRIEKNMFTPNKSKYECEGIKETIKQFVVDAIKKMMRVPLTAPRGSNKQEMFLH